MQGWRNRCHIIAGAATACGGTPAVTGGRRRPRNRAQTAKRKAPRGAATHHEADGGVGEAGRGRGRPELAMAATAGLGEGDDADGDSSLLGPIPPAGRGKGGWRSFLATRRSSGTAVTAAASGGRTRLGLGFAPGKTTERDREGSEREGE